VAAAHASRRPAPPLDAFIETVWTSARDAPAAHPREWNLPTGCADLIVPLSQGALHRFAGRDDIAGHWHAGGVLQGAHEQPTLRDTATPLAVVGAHFRPGGLAGFVAAPAHELSDEAWSLDSLWPGFSAQLQERLLAGGRLAPAPRRLDVLEESLRRLLRPAAVPDPWVGWAVTQLSAMPNHVGQVQRASGCSPSRFIERYRAACGLAPKRHAALMRFNALLQAAGGLRPPAVPERVAADGLAWAQAASEAGYADQPHMSREFRRFAGLTPGDYRRSATAYPNHVACR
jgi:AraC-like DNA-binding protein